MLSTRQTFLGIFKIIKIYTETNSSGEASVSLGPLLWLHSLPQRYPLSGSVTPFQTISTSVSAYFTSCISKRRVSFDLCIFSGHRMLKVDRRKELKSWARWDTSV